MPHWTERENKLHPNIGTRFTPPEQLHSPFYPYGGPYSSSNRDVVKKHMHYLKENNVDVIVISWWGQCQHNHSTDTQGVCTDNTVPLIFEVANKVGGVWIAFHVEPYRGRSPGSIRADLEYIHRSYGHYPSLYRLPGPRESRVPRPVFYVYDSYHIPGDQWRELLTPQGSITVRDSPLDGIFIGLWLSPSDGAELSQAGFDGTYTYFVADSTSYGANPRNWGSMCGFCRTHGMLCDLSVGPGYDDTRIRPWNRVSTRDRQGGEYYSGRWERAIEAAPDVSILPV